jgi:uroporphyrinogen decarboxylase
LEIPICTIKNYMTPKERVATALAHKEPDCVPINYFANLGIDKRLKEHYRLELNDHEGLRLKLGVDFRGVFPEYKGPRLHPERTGLNVDPAWGIHTKYVAHQSGSYWDYCDFPLKYADLEAIKKWPMPSPDDFDYDMVTKTCDLYPSFALHIGNAGLCDIINSTGMLRSMETVLMDLALDDPAGLMLIDRKIEIQLEVVRRSLELAGERIDFLWMGEDLGTQHSPLISLDLFRKHIRPRQQKFVDLAKKYDLPVMIHTCGSSSWAYEDFIEMGINAVDTLQPEAKNMSPAYLKKNFGQRLAFHGCISTAGPVASGCVRDVVEDVRATLNIMMPGGGYCLAPTHALQDNSPTQNVIAIYDAVKEYGRYK